MFTTFLCSSTSFSLSHPLSLSLLISLSLSLPLTHTHSHRHTHIFVFSYSLKAAETVTHLGLLWARFCQPLFRLDSIVHLLLAVYWLWKSPHAHNSNNIFVFYLSAAHLSWLRLFHVATSSTSFWSGIRLDRRGWVSQEPPVLHTQHTTQRAAQIWPTDGCLGITVVATASSPGGS